MDHPILFVIRHGRTSFNIAGKFRGEADIPLVSLGIKDSEDSAEFLSKKNIEPAFMVSSDKKRAVQTADILGKKFGLTDEPTDQLRAWNLGDFSGQPKNKENVEAVERYVQDPDVQVPGGESLNEFRDRILPVLAECFEYATRNGIGLIVAHSSVIHELGTQILGDHKSLVVEPGGIVVIGFEDGKITAERIFKPLRNVESAASVS